MQLLQHDLDAKDDVLVVTAVIVLVVFEVHAKDDVLAVAAVEKQPERCKSDQLPTTTLASAKLELLHRHFSVVFVTCVIVSV